MCGFAGVLGNDVRLDVVRGMAAAIINRGPDDSGVWSDVEASIALAHRRLSVVDLSPAGHQPMASASGRYVIVFNGEIYNHLDMRTELEKSGGSFQWRGHSDTETLLAGIDVWGIRSHTQEIHRHVRHRLVG